MNARILLIPILLAGFAHAQTRTWIVDQMNGPGTDFPDLPAAIAQANDGDVVVVRPGTYTGFTTGKGLTILGEGTVSVLRPLAVPTLPVVEITGLARGRTLVIRNVQVLASPGGGPTMSLTSCRGRVHLEDVNVDARNAFVQTPTGLSLFDCDGVTITRGRLDGWPALRASRSLLTLTGTVAVGGSASWSPRGATTSGNGVSLSGSVLLSTGADVRGGDGSLLFPNGSPAIVAVDSVLRLTGDAASAVTAGTSFGALALPAVETTAGYVLADTQIQVSGTSGGPGFTGTAMFEFRRVAALSSSSATLGGVATIEFLAPAGDPIALVLGTPGDPVFTPQGFLFLEPGSIVPLWFGLQIASGRSTWTLPVPQIPALRGAVVAFQGARVDVAFGASEFTNPAILVLD